MTRERFIGRIAGVGSTTGTRLVVGWWQESPLGTFADVMVERRDGHRLLLAPNDTVREFVSATYTFDECRVEPIDVHEHSRIDAAHDLWQVRSPSLVLDLTLGRRTALGWALRGVPHRVATSAAWASAVDPIARIILRGVRTRGIARPGRKEWYGATDVGGIDFMTGSLDGTDLGELAPVDPPCRFGFSSTPRRPSVTTVVTTIDT